MEMFKLNAINRLTLDLNRFKEVIRKITSTNKQILEILLDCEKIMLKKNKRIGDSLMNKNSS